MAMPVGCGLCRQLRERIGDQSSQCDSYGNSDITFYTPILQSRATTAWESEVIMRYAPHLAGQCTD